MKTETLVIAVSLIVIIAAAGVAAAFLLPDDNNDDKGGDDGGQEIPTTYYTINASSTTGGTISPFGDVKVAEGESQTFTFTANKNYKLSHILIDDVSKSALTSFKYNCL